MADDKVQMNLKLVGEDAIFWRTLKQKIGATTDVQVFFFILSQYKDFLKGEIRLFDMKEVREVYDKRKELEERLDTYTKEIAKLKTSDIKEEPREISDKRKELEERLDTYTKEIDKLKKQLEQLNE